MANGLFDTDYSYLGLPRLGSAVRGPIDISQEAINNLSYLDDQAVLDPIEDEIQSYFDFPLDTVSEAVSYTPSDAADDLLCVDLGGRRNIKKKNSNKTENVEICKERKANIRKQKDKNKDKK